MLDEIRKIAVFIKRDFRLLFTYKLAFSTSFFNVVFGLFYFVLFGRMFSSTASNVLLPYGGDFISYILIGAIGWSFLWSIMNATSVSLRSEMMVGTLESILLTSTKILTMMFSYALYGSIFGLLSISLLLIVGYFIFGISAFATASIFTVIIFILSTAMMFGFGLIFGGLTIWQKNIGGTIVLFQNISMFFCGVYFPISVLPEFLQPIVHYMPFYYSIEGIRLSLIPSTSLNDILFYIVILLFLTILFVLLGVIVLNRGLVKTKKDGSLVFY